jgi:hypothetical protein
MNKHIQGEEPQCFSLVVEGRKLSLFEAIVSRDGVADRGRRGSEIGGHQWADTNFGVIGLSR